MIPGTSFNGGRSCSGAFCCTKAAVTPMAVDSAPIAEHSNSCHRCACRLHITLNNPTLVHHLQCSDSATALQCRLQQSFQTEHCKGISFSHRHSTLDKHLLQSSLLASTQQWQQTLKCTTP